MQTTVHATHDPTQPGFFLVIRTIVFSLIMFFMFPVDYIVNRRAVRTIGRDESY